MRAKKGAIGGDTGILPDAQLENETVQKGQIRLDRIPGV